MHTIKNKFILTLVVILVSMLGMLALGQYTTHKLGIFNAVSLEISQVESGMLMQRRNEKDFLARNDLKYKVKFDSNFSKLTERVEKLGESVAAAALDTVSIPALKKAFIDYKNSFHKLVSIQEIIGMHSKDGLYGSLREAVHQAEIEIKALEDQGLRADMLQLRRNEKDFMLRLDMKYLTKFDHNVEKFSARLSTSSHPLANKEKIESLMAQYRTQFTELVTNSQLKGLNSKEGVLGTMRSKVHDGETLLAEISEEIKATVKEEVGSLDTFQLVTNLIGLVLVIIVLTTLGLLAFGIIRPVQELAQIMTKAANENDLTLRIPIKTQDEIGETSQAFNNMMEKFQTSILQVNGAATQIATASGDMSAVTLKTTQGIQEQQLQTDQLATAMNEMTATVQEVAKNAAEAADSALNAKNESDTGRQIVNTTTSIINALSESINDASNSIQRVHKDSEKIESVLNVIRGIAEQTNLLALNAAIEAARAGEQGRGFAVVADEVRTLAGRTQEATQEIQQMIESFQTGTKDSVQLMEKSNEFSKQSVEQTSKAGDSLVSIVNAVDLINEMNTQIATAAEEQSAVAEEINRNVVSISQIADQTTQGAEHTKQASGDLSQLAIDLQTLVVQFNV
jgi:methyl-accepting chemotaxis protein